uniref:Uncharacterized protein n=1 Tax=Glossina pallidipes TaxID=7398 RepID=A0A1A9ZYK8_GLOPL
MDFIIELFGLPELLMDCSWVGSDPVEEFEVSLICMAGAGICGCAVAAAEFCTISKECRLRGVAGGGADEELTRWTSMVEGVVHDCKRLLLFTEAEEFESLEFKAGERGPAEEGLILLLILLGLNVTEFCEVLTKTDELVKESDAGVVFDVDDEDDDGLAVENDGWRQVVTVAPAVLTQFAVMFASAGVALSFAPD